MASRERQRRYEKSEKGRASARKRAARYRAKYPEVKMFGLRFRVPDQNFKQFAIALRDERKRHQTEGAIQDGRS